MTVDRPTADELRRVMRQHAAGVVIVTADVGGPTGFCATSLTSVSLSPPMVSFAVTLPSASGQAWLSTTHGIVHLLSAEQRDIAATFARPGAAKFDTGWTVGPQGQPLLDGVLAWLLVRPRTRLVVGDHLLVIAEVEGSRSCAETGPLVYHDGTFHALPV